jgi:anthranilate phosphoribosyltransferase
MPSTRTQWLKHAPLAATTPRAETPLFPFIARFIRGEDLTAGEAAQFFRALTDPAAGSNQIAAAITALTAKGETPEELAGMATVMRQLSIRVKSPANAIDIAGTGSSTARTFSVSTAAAFVAAGAGLSVAKQCNRGAMTKSGSTDLLKELGVNPSEETKVVQASLSGTGLGFMSAPHFHPALRRLGDVRAKLGIRTCLNVLGLLANPAGVTRNLIGVWHRSLVEPVGKALSLLKTEHAWVVHGSDGLDEVALNGKTFITSVKGNEVRSYVVSPSDFGIKPAKTDHIRTTTAKENAAIVRDVLGSRRRDEARSLVILNAAAAIFIGGLAKDPMHAARMAEQSIDSGMAHNKLERLIQVTRKK